jgi:xanthine dehydrogenase accessory factor
MQKATFFEELTAALKDQRPVALAILVETVGSTPQRPGAKMLVYGDGTTLGTVGGGMMEYEVIQRALKAFEGGHAELLSIKLSKEAGYMCGGSAKVYIEPLLPTSELIILGAGHIGQALAFFAQPLGFRVVLLDGREEFLGQAKKRNASIKTTRVVNYADPFQEVWVGPSSYIVVATFSHAHDFEGVRAALKTKASYIGLVGSKTKRAALEDHLKREGVEVADIARIMTPAGLPIGAVTPQEIAISILAEIIRLRRSYDLSEHNGASSCSRAVPAHGKPQAPA